MKFNFRVFLGFLLVGIIILLLVPIPKPNEAYSSLLLSREGELLAAEVASDQQWRLPRIQEIPIELYHAIRLFEDEYFEFHPGINPISIIKAAYINLRRSRIVRGASTLTMQLMRIRNTNKNRNYTQKIIEMIQALKFDLFHSKKNIVKMWASEAPFGGNVVGVEMASWKYFDRILDDLSWAEYALLAILPNGPSHINLWKNTKVLIQKRNSLLQKLAIKGLFSVDDLELFQSEQLPLIKHDNVQLAYHALQFFKSQNKSQHRFHSSINFDLQKKIQDIVNETSRQYQKEDIHNAAVVILDIQSNELIAYIGNVKDQNGKMNYVDIVQSPRSYGSLLKPFLYAYAIDNGLLLPQQLVADIPTNIAGFRPKNFDKKYRGATDLKKMVQQSLNIPAVRVLNQVGLNGFYNWLQTIDLKYLDKGSERYGLSLILGGGESNLYDLTNAYKALGRRALEMSGAFNDVEYLMENKSNNIIPKVKLSPWASFMTLEVMTEVERPQKEKYWHYLDKNNKISWKTGTSYGHRDAWAIGINRQYAVGVWIGNETGESRQGLTGIVRAAPLLFKIFNSFSTTSFYEEQVYNMEYIRVCSESGMLAGRLCNHTEKTGINQVTHQLKACSFHLEIAYNKKLEVVEQSCPNIISYDTIFHLNPAMEYYYSQHDLNYKLAPEITKYCSDINTISLAIIYPREGLNIFVPVELAGRKQSFIAKAYSSQSDTLFWYLDDEFLGKTIDHHELKINERLGDHQLLVVGSSGIRRHINFAIVNKE